jgi:hypothetical protein
MLTNIGGFREDLRGSQEYDLHLRLAAAERDSFTSGKSFIPSGDLWKHVVDYVRTVSEQLKFLPNLVASLQAAGDLTESAPERSRIRTGTKREAVPATRREETRTRVLEAARAVHPSGGLEAVYSTATRWLYGWWAPCPQK